MSAEQRFEAFAQAWERGEQPDPAATIDAAGHDEREQLSAMIATYLTAHPRADVPEAEVAARAADPCSEPPQAWADLLPALRARTGTTRGKLVAALAADLGHPEATAQVEEHVHGLETGALAPARVRPPVVAALARILDVPEALLEAGRQLAPPPAPAAAAFMRPGAEAVSADVVPPEPQEHRSAEIDELFGTDG